MGIGLQEESETVTGGGGGGVTGGGGGGVTESREDVPSVQNLNFGDQQHLGAAPGAQRWTSPRMSCAAGVRGGHGGVTKEGMGVSNSRRDGFDRNV